MAKAVSIKMELGDDAMQASYDVADALENLAKKIRSLGIATDDRIPIMDDNGNTVGEYVVS